MLAAGSLAERSATARRFFLGALSTVAKLAAEYDVRRLILRLAREYRAAADVAVQRHRRLPVASAIRWVGLVDLGLVVGAGGDWGWLI